MPPVCTWKSAERGHRRPRRFRDDLEASFKRLNGVNERTSGEEVAPLKRELQSCMQNYFGVFRTGEYMQKGIAQLADLRERIANVKINDKSQAFNTARIGSAGTAKPPRGGRGHRDRGRAPQGVPWRPRP